MGRPTADPVLRESLVTILFGLGGPWAALFLGLPFYRALGPLAPWLIGLLLGLPLGLLLRGRRWFYWRWFAALFFFMQAGWIVFDYALAVLYGIVGVVPALAEGLGYIAVRSALITAPTLAGSALAILIATSVLEEKRVEKLL